MYINRITFKQEKDPAHPAFWGFLVLEIEYQFVVHDVRLVFVNGGKLLVQMPFKRRDKRCSACRGINCEHAQYCESCGSKFIPTAVTSRQVHDICHPKNRRCRFYLNDIVRNAINQVESLGDKAQKMFGDPLQFSVEYEPRDLNPKRITRIQAE